MPVFFIPRITKALMHENPKTIIVFGDNVKRVGRGGLAAVCRDEPNAIGIPTKWAPGRAPGDFFDDKDFDRIIQILCDDLMRVDEILKIGGDVIFPTAPLGSGLAELPARAPRANQFLYNCVAALAKTYGMEQSPWK